MEVRLVIRFYQLSQDKFQTLKHKTSFNLSALGLLIQSVHKVPRHLDISWMVWDINNYASSKPIILYCFYEWWKCLSIVKNGLVKGDNINVLNNSNLYIGENHCKALLTRKIMTLTEPDDIKMIKYRTGLWELLYVITRLILLQHRSVPYTVCVSSQQLQTVLYSNQSTIIEIEFKIEIKNNKRQCHLSLSFCLLLASSRLSFYFKIKLSLQ